jgi:Fe2+ or Zn2+ uptake regulation protein
VQQRIVIQAVLDYLVRHPSAADSAEGVARWWLMDLSEPVQPGAVKLALESMVRQGLLRTATLADGSTLYAGCASTGRRMRRGGPDADN